MRKKLALILAVIMIAGLFSGCGNNSQKGQKPGASGEMDVAYYAYYAIPVLTWDPSVEFSNGVIVLNNIYEQLLKYDPKTKEYEKVLATDYKKSDDGLTWTFNLRKGVKFQDGTPFTAEAVKFSVDRTKSMGQGASYIWASVKEVKIVDDYTVEFDLSYPAQMDLIVSCPYAAFIMSPSLKDKPSDWFEQQNACGTGPYKLQESNMGDQVILTKNDDYWKGWDGEHFEKVVIKKVAETSSRRQMVEKGEVDITTELPYEDVEALKTGKNVNVDVAPAFQNLMAFFNTKKGKLSDVKVRQALSYAFPYDDVVNYAMGGYAKQSYGAVPEGLWGHDESIMQYKYDINKAKQLLNEAGIKSGELKLLLTYQSGDEAEKKTAELYKGELSKIGVDLEIRSMPWESQWEMAKSTSGENQQDIFIMYWWPDVTSPYSFLNTLFHTEKEIYYNLGYYSNPQYDSLIDAAQEKSAVNVEEAQAGFIDAQKILLKDCPAIFAYDKNLAWVTSPTFKGHVDNPAYPFVVFFYDCYREK